MEPNVEIIVGNREFWFKVVDFLQQNWALIEQPKGDDGCTVYFMGDTSLVFDRLSFSSPKDAEEALRRNGFARFSDDEAAQEFLAVPTAPYFEGSHPNGPIYSSGRFWR